MISCKNKEIIQYMQNWENYKNKKMIRSPDDFIYITNSKNYLYKYSFNEYNLKLIKKIKINDKNKEINDSFIDDEDEEEISRDQKLNNFNITISGNKIFIYNSNIYALSDI